MKEENWKRIMQTWKSSRKHHQLKQRIKKLEMFNITQKELEEMITGIMTFNDLSDEDKEAFDWLDLEVKNNATKMDVVQSLIETLLKWYYHQVKYERLELYELCAKIRDVIDVEISEARRIINTYFVPEDTDEEIFEELKLNARKQVSSNYDVWVKTLSNN